MAEPESTSDSDSQSANELTWIQWFCSMRGNEFFCEVDEEFIQDEFNLYGLSQVVPNYDYALDMILDNESDEDLTEEQQEVIERNAEMLYGLIHARFITTAHGQQLMMEKFKQAEFGRCPRVFCNGSAVLPVGLSDTVQQNTVKLYCPRCQDIFFPKYSRHATIDGAFFGTTFPHLLLLQFTELMPQKVKFTYTPKIFGFKLHPTAMSVAAAASQQQALQAQQIQQMAMRVEDSDEEELPPTTATQPQQSSATTAPQPIQASSRMSSTGSLGTSTNTLALPTPGPVSSRSISSASGPTAVSGRSPSAKK